MTKRAPITSPSVRAQALSRQPGVIEPPAHAPLHTDAAPFWPDIVAQRSREEWTPHDLAFAADLANTMAQLADNRRRLRTEGEVSKSAGGSPMTNPRVGVVNSLHAQVKAARQSLGLHSAAKGDHRDTLKRRAHAKALDDIADDVATDDLLAKPTGPVQ